MERWQFTVIRYVSLAVALLALLLENPRSWVLVPLVTVIALCVVVDVVPYVFARRRERVCDA
jgi:hypothetical protein